MPQKLSPAARKKKAARDLAYAKTPRRRAMKAENQKKRRDALKKGSRNILTRYLPRRSNNI